MIRTPNFKARNERIETGVVTKSQKGRKVNVGRKVEECSGKQSTVFKRRLLQFQSLRSTGKPARSLTKGTFVLSYPKSADTD